MENKLDNLVDRAIRETAAAQGGHVIPGFEVNFTRDTISPGTRIRCAWEVRASVIPDQPIAEYTRRWILTSEQWEKDLEDSAPVREMPEDEYQKWLAAGNKVKSTFVEYQTAATDYARKLQNPAGLNWVTVDWIWY